MGDPAGLAALSICESMLLSLTEAGIIDNNEAMAILEDAAMAHRGAVGVTDGATADHLRRRRTSSECSRAVTRCVWASHNRI
jgi:hypothetical protein